MKATGMPYPPRDVISALRSIEERADGYFVFTPFSLWLEPSKLYGPCTLQGAPADYWQALRETNQP
jgi:hypothetical protein